MTSVGKRSFVVLMAIAAVGLLGGSCGGGPAAIVITSPSETSLFSNAPTIQVDGQLQNVNLAAVADVTVNGVSVLPLGPGKTFSTTVSLDPAAIFNPIVAEVSFTDSGRTLRDRRTVIAGDGNPGPGGTGFVLDGDLSPQAIALRLRDSGLDQAEPVIAGSIDLDLAAMLPVGTFLGVVAGFDTFVDNPPPRFGSFSIDVDAQTDSVDANIDLANVAVDLFLDGWWIFDCTARITTPVLEINGSYGLQPDGGDSTLLDVDQIGGVSFGSTQFSLQITSGVACVLGELFGLIGNVNGEIQNGLSGFLNVVDANGNTPVAAAIEGALAGIQISGPIGTALGVSLETPISDVLEDLEGLTLETEARVTALLLDPDAPDLTASYHVNGSFPGFSSTTPGGLPYDLGLAISTSTFNQLLKAETESGLLRLTGANAITELDLDGPGGAPPIPLTALVMSAFIPEFAGFPADKLFKIELKPVLAPILTEMAGPQGELVELRVAHLLLEIRDVAQDVLFLQAVVDCRLGADVAFLNGEIAFSLGALLPADIDAVVLVNIVNTNEIVLVQILQFLLPSLLPALTDSLGSFPLPDFLGLSLQGVEVARQASFLSIFADLAAPPAVPIELYAFNGSFITSLSSTLANGPLAWDSTATPTGGTLVGYGFGLNFHGALYIVGSDLLLYDALSGNHTATYSGTLVNGPLAGTAMTSVLDYANNGANNIGVFDNAGTIELYELSNGAHLATVATTLANGPLAGQAASSNLVGYANDGVLNISLYNNAGTLMDYQGANILGIQASTLTGGPLNSLSAGSPAGFTVIGAGSHGPYGGPFVAFAPSTVPDP